MHKKLIDRIVINQRPPSVNTVWINKPRGRFMSKKGKEFKEKAIYEIKQQYKDVPIQNNIKMKIQLFFKDKRRRDIDNYNKVLIDSMKDIVFVDDEQIYQLEIEKNIGAVEDKVIIDIYKI